MIRDLERLLAASGTALRVVKALAATAPYAVCGARRFYDRHGCAFVEVIDPYPG